MSQYLIISKFDIALSQLNLAIKLYMSDEEYPSVITLAGAAEEILGTLASKNGHENALDRKKNELMSMYEHLRTKLDFFSETEINPKKTFVDISNKARNKMKHLSTDKEDKSREDVELDFEAEAAKLIKRALINYKLYSNHQHPDHYKFESKHISNWKKNMVL